MEAKEPTYPFYARRISATSPSFNGAIAYFESKHKGICVRENDYSGPAESYKKGDITLDYGETFWQILDAKETEELLREITEFPFYVKDTKSEMVVKFTSEDCGEVVVADKENYPYSYDIGMKCSSLISCFDAEEWTPLTKEQIKGVETPLKPQAVESEEKEQNKINTARDWAALAREGKTMDIPDGYVYIGEGDEDNSLCDYMKIAGSFNKDKKVNPNHNLGVCDYLNYVATIEEWEKGTGLCYAEVMDFPKKRKTLPKEFYIFVSNPEYSAAVQKRLFELGYDWSYKQKTVNYTDKRILVVDSDNEILWTSNPKCFAKEITMGELFSNNYEVVFTPTEFEFKNYEGLITKNSVKVGCQEITFDKLKILKEIVAKYESDYGSAGISMKLSSIMEDEDTDIVLSAEGIEIITVDADLEMTFAEFAELINKIDSKFAAK